MQRVVASVLLLITILATVSGQQYCNYANMDAVKIGDTVPICLHLSTGKRMVFPIKVDTFTGLQASGVYSGINNDATPAQSLTVQFQNGTATTGYINSTIDPTKTEKRVAQLMSFVIVINKGVVTSIVRDNKSFADAGCGTNSTSGVMEGDTNCFTLVSNTTSDNDPKIFISWSGTDSTGQYMLSQSQRIAKFTQYSVSNVVDDARKIFQK